MAPKLLILHTAVFLAQVLISAGQSAVKQYLHVTGIGPHSHSAGLTSLPTVGFTRQTVPSGIAAMASGGLAAVPNSGLALPGGIAGVPNTGLSSLGALAALPGLLQALTSSASPSQQATTSTGAPTLKTQALQPTPSAPSVPTCKQNCPATNTPNGGLDSAVLNNLAIALQLLIVSNILNSNLPENEANPIYEMLETAKSIPTSLSQTQSGNVASSSNYQDPFEQYLPNANFVGSSGFSEATVSDPYIKPTSRSGSFQLMSPYEALGPNSPFSDPILASPYGSFMSSKKDFQSPYSMMDSDPFSMNDLF